MDEDKALNRIRALTHNDDPPFPVLMDMIIELAYDLKLEYVTRAEARRRKMR